MVDKFSQNEHKRRSINSRSQYKSRDALQNYRYRNKNKNGSMGLVLLASVFGILVVAVLVVFAAVKMTNKKIEDDEIKNYSKEQMKNDIYVDYSSIGINELVSLKGKTRQDAYDYVLSLYNFDIKIKNSNPELDLFVMPNIDNDVDIVEDLDKNLNVVDVDSEGTSQEISIDNPYRDITIKATKEVYSFPNFLDKQIMDFIDKTYYKYLNKSIDKKKNPIIDDMGNIVANESFVLDENDRDVDDYISQLARIWNTKATTGMVEGFDTKKNEFTFGQEHVGYELDQGKLRQNIYGEIKNGKFDASIWTPINIISPVGESVKAKYKYSSIFETTTSDDSVRNTNVSLACKAINGTIVKPGEEFSFNEKVGKRTSEKGFGYANAYVGGEVVKELGGGVCQVSTTLYNAVFGAGLTTTYRRSHTFEPNYVTPGLDATVSYNGVDYRFVNDTDYNIGIRATYAKNKCKVEIFSVPKLQKGQKQFLVSKKIEDLGYPDISIIASGAPTRGTKGSEWQVFKVVTDGNDEIERIFDHSAKYVGHAPTAYEEDTYTDDDGKIQTSKFNGKVKVPATTMQEEKKVNDEIVEEETTTAKKTTKKVNTDKSNTKKSDNATQETTMEAIPIPLSPAQSGQTDDMPLIPNQNIVTPY